MNQPKVSVLISFYNLAPYVDKTMETVLAQKTNFPVEVLCADDGSDDGTIEKLRVWEQKYPDTVRVFVMDRIPGAKYEANDRIKRMNAIRGRLFYEAKGEYVSYLDGDDFYTDDHKLQKQADVLDADTEHKYIGCGHNGCYYWESTGKTVPIERPIRECSLTAEEYWSFLYVHTNALLLRNLGLQGIDPYKSGIPIIDNPLTFQFLPYGDIYYLPDCMFNYRQIEGSTYHRRSPYQKHPGTRLFGRELPQTEPDSCSQQSICRTVEHQLGSFSAKGKAQRHSDQRAAARQRSRGQLSGSHPPCRHRSTQCAQHTDAAQRECAKPVQQHPQRRTCRAGGKAVLCKAQHKAQTKGHQRTVQNGPAACKSHCHRRQPAGCRAQLCPPCQCRRTPVLPSCCYQTHPLCHKKSPLSGGVLLFCAPRFLHIL